MRHYVVVSHAYMAKGIISSLEVVLGKQENLSYYCAYLEKGDDFLSAFKKEISTYGPTDEIVVFTDMFGGSVNNEMEAMLGQRNNLYLVTGMNLPLIIGIVLSPQDEPVEEMIRRNIEDAKNGIIFCNELFKNEEKSEGEEMLDDF